MQRLQELADLQLVFHVPEVEVAQFDESGLVATAQQQTCVQGHQHRRTIADRRAIGDVAAQGARMAHRGGGKTQPHLTQSGPMVGQRLPRLLQRSRSTNVQHARALPLFNHLNREHLSHSADINHLGQHTQLFVDPQTHIGATGQQGGLWVG